MTRKKIQMKRIDNTTARQVTFSERRKCIFKKALELSTLCEAEIALIVIRATGKLFDYGSPSGSGATSFVEATTEVHGLLMGWPGGAWWFLAQGGSVVRKCWQWGYLTVGHLNASGGWQWPLHSTTRRERTSFSTDLFHNTLSARGSVDSEVSDLLLQLYL
ncbi:MADS-box transcription factor 25-like [Carya illinoinensis]|uniref:MADS-box transcription factor 25-like n=1 Tax=Carya illinoinensis TaxID=32201 RepID=UPI001C72428C|nr:MADS-box transcription factor 25-like [Carya illinoinensis]